MNNLPEWLGRRNKCLHLRKTRVTKIQLSSCFWQNSLHSTEGPAQPLVPLAVTCKDRDVPLPRAHGREHKPQPKDKGFKILILPCLELPSTAKTLKLFHWTIQCQREANSRSSLPWTRDPRQGWLKTPKQWLWSTQRNPPHHLGRTSHCSAHRWYHDYYQATHLCLMPRARNTSSLTPPRPANAGESKKYFKKSSGEGLTTLLLFTAW